MRVGIDISQLVYKKTGVAAYLKSLINALLQSDNKNDYILVLFSRHKFSLEDLGLKPSLNVKFISFPFPPLILDFVWNKLHILPIEKFIGKIDVFISSDWTQPPVLNALNATILYDLIVYKYPKETDRKIVETQRRKLALVKKECDMVFCISNSTAQDAYEVLGIDKCKLKVIYPGI